MARRKAAVFTSMPEEIQMEAMKRVAAMTPLTGYLVSGETARRQGWVVPIILHILDRGLVKGTTINRGGRFENYDSLPDAVFVGGVEPVISPDDLGYYNEAYTAMKCLETMVTEEAVASGTALRLGLPHVLDLLLSGFPSKIDDPKYRSAFLDAYTHELQSIDVQWGGKVSYWLETPLSLKMVRDSYHQGKDYERVAQEMASFAAEVIECIPLGVDVDIHLCNGDFGGRGWDDNIDLMPTVTLANAMKETLGENVEVIHIPIASGNVKPTVDMRFYEPLRKLRDDMVISAGFVHPDVDLETHKAALRIIEDITRRSVRPASYCGHGRMSLERSRVAFELVTELCKA